MRVPVAGYRPDHRAGVELAAIDAHRAAEAAADLEGRLDDGVARETRRDRFEIRDFTGRAAAGHSVPPRSVRWVRAVLDAMRSNDRNGPACLCIALAKRGAASASTRQSASMPPAAPRRTATRACRRS